MLLLSGDIGGTKTILRLVNVASDKESFNTIKEAKFVSAKFTDLVPMVELFLRGNKLEQPQTACFGIAGPVVNNTSNLTNLNWQLTASRLEQELSIDKVYLINDFAANSYSVLDLEESELATLQTGKTIKNAPIAVIGAGTGLGESFLITQDGKYHVFPSEGGHTDFAPRNELEIQLLKYLQKKLNKTHISVERVVSGQGIVGIYQFLRDTNFAAENQEIANQIKSWETNSEQNIDPAAIIAQGAKEKQDTLCEKTMIIFIEAYGAETGNLALKMLPYGGIYIAGGIAAKNLSLIKKGSFLKAYNDKGRMSNLLTEIPIHVVLNPEVGLLGSILYALKTNI
ncbi:Glucokinase [Hyella patelloides LEGE 07179]|uniref:Glucokinase n=1 Tax=Hyella patelloides LEGE 07179 TaxID=945734 RepID=A0A563VSJ1_9CYAN|nr:glucokinase [Hyella patelloides]VEP14373.1 Glucokinase [Hyella patelloides LEGE 07179]